ncbi:acetyltransferase [Desulfovirgula thermocuniculi]|uniref:acetyltransferase n=1 Tax=Desulfovirgula thermocuniculi TaxID=348842 RepID=UPI0009FDEE49|nr:acetyltransferase [Desulfovirgula thermocuniculi]
MSRQQIIIIGAGGHALMIASIIEELGAFAIVGYTAPAPGKGPLSGRYKYLGDDEVLPGMLKRGVNLAAMGVGGTGDNRLRSELFVNITSMGFEFPPLQHPRAIVAPGVELNSGSVIAPGAVIGPGAKIGVNVIVNSGAVIEHECLLGDHVHVAPGSILCGGVKIDRLAHVGAGAVVIQGISIGEGAIIGAGAVVVKDVEPWSVVVGNPARVIKRRCDT